MKHRTFLESRARNDKQFTIRYKLYLIVIVPLLALTFYSFNLFVEKKAVLIEMERLEKLSHLALQVSDLVHETQKERGITSLFLASKKEDFSTKLSSQRLLTDEKLSDLVRFLDLFEEKEFGKEFHGKLQSATINLKSLNTKRDAINFRGLSFKDSIDYFTVLNHSFLEIIESMSQFSTMSETGNIVFGILPSSGYEGAFWNSKSYLKCCIPNGCFRARTVCEICTISASGRIVERAIFRFRFAKIQDRLFPGIK